MDAKKCDRCGEFYEVYNTKHYTMHKRNGVSWENVDLCPRCYDDFVAFMENTDMVPVYYKYLEEEEFGDE